MKVRSTWFALLVCVIAGCGPASVFEVTLVDDASDVTDAPGDRLCSLTLGSASDPIATSDLQVWLTPPGGAITRVEFALADSDADGQLDPGDTLTILEPAANIVGSAEVGMTFSVELLRDLGASRVTSLWEGSWTAQ